MKVNEKRMRELVREALIMRRTYPRGTPQPSADRFIEPLENEIMRLSANRQRGSGESDRDYERRIQLIDATISDLSAKIDRIRRREPTPAGMRAGLDQDSIYDLSYVRDVKRRFDKNCEVARTGYRVRMHSSNNITRGILNWPSRAELPCHIFKRPPVAGYGPVLILLEGGFVTFASFTDMVSDAVLTASGVRQYPGDEAAAWSIENLDPGEKISISWADVERVMANEVLNDSAFLARENLDLGPHIEEALVVGSRPGAIIVSSAVGNNSNMSRSVDEIIEDISIADLPLVDRYLRLISLDGARRILEGA